MQISTALDDREVRQALERLQAKAINLSPILEEIGQRYERRILENWAKEQGPDGTSWPRLSANTLMVGIRGKGKKSGFKKNGYLGAKGKEYLLSKSMLVESGRMRSRVHYQVDGSGLTIGVAGIPYAAIHQFGGMAGRGKKVQIPARPWLALNNGDSLELAQPDQEMILEAVERHLTP